MKTSLIHATTEDNLILQGLISEPDKTSNRIILHIHGMTGNFYEGSFLDAMRDMFTKNGWAFMSVNTRGRDFIADFPVAGDKEEYKRIGNFREKFEECVLDIKAWLDLIEQRGYKHIILQGHSLGAVKIVYYLGKTQDKRVSKLILASPPDVVRLFEMEQKNHDELVKIAKKMIRNGKGEEILPGLIWEWYYLSAKTYIDFSERDKLIDVFNTYDKDKPSVLREIRVPVLAFYGSLDDAAILPLRDSLEVIKKKATNCPKFDAGIIEGAPHSYFGHEKEMARRIVNWLEKGKF